MRHDDWKPRLIRFLGEVASTPYCVGENDCALFAARAVAAMTGNDLSDRFVGRYSTIRGGMRVLRQAGYQDHIAMVAAHFEEVPVSFAAAGDLAVVAVADGDALGVVQGEVVYVLADADRSLATVPIDRATRVFRV